MMIFIKEDVNNGDALINNKFLKTGVLLVVVAGLLAVYLNIEGFNCLSKLSREESALLTENLQELERNCFIITNSYVYALFGVVIGIILIFIWYNRHRKR